MTVLESILKGIQSLSLRKQIDVASHVYRLSTEAHRERSEVLSRTHGRLNEADGRAFEEALASR